MGGSWQLPSTDQDSITTKYFWCLRWNRGLKYFFLFYNYPRVSKTFTQQSWCVTIRNLILSTGYQVLWLSIIAYREDFLLEGHLYKFFWACIVHQCDVMLSKIYNRWSYIFIAWECNTKYRYLNMGHHLKKQYHFGVSACGLCCFLKQLKNKMCKLFAGKRVVWVTRQLSISNMVYSLTLIHEIPNCYKE